MFHILSLSFFILVMMIWPPRMLTVRKKSNVLPKMKSFFIQLLHDHVKNGDLQASTFKKKVWSEISEELLGKCGKKCTIKQLKSKFNRL